VDFRRSKGKSKLTARDVKLFSGSGNNRLGGASKSDDRYSTLYELIGVVSPSKNHDQGIPPKVATEARDGDDSVVSPLLNIGITTGTTSLREVNEKKKDSDSSSSGDEKEDLWAQWGVVRQGNVPLADSGRGGNTSSSSSNGREGSSGLSTSVQPKKTNQARSRSDKYKPQSSLHDNNTLALSDDIARKPPFLDLSSLTSPPNYVKLPTSKPPNASSMLSLHSRTAAPEYSMNIGGVERALDVSQPRSLIETERTRQARVGTSHKANSSSRIVRY